MLLTRRLYLHVTLLVHQKATLYYAQSVYVFRYYLCHIHKALLV